MRVLVPRPRPGADETAARLACLGHTALLAPVLSISPIADAPPRGPWNALLVTSRNALPALSRHGAQLRDIPVFAVGARTGEDLRRAGFAQTTEAAGDAADLAALVSRRVALPATLLHVCGRDRRPEPARSLRDAGYGLVTWEVYVAEPVDALSEDARAALGSGRLDAALHYSPRSAAVLLRLAAEAGLAEPFARLHHLCLSTQVAAALDGVGPGRIDVASAPNEDRLLALLDDAD